jgi:hypothetical protein
MFAAAGDDFYDNAFRKGVADFDAAMYESAMVKLRIAAFGFVDDAGRFETAQAYIAVAAQRLKQEDEARRALVRIVAAERIEKHFATLQISPAARKDLEAAAKALLTPQQAAMLIGPPPTSQIAAPTPTTPPRE